MHVETDDIYADIAAEPDEYDTSDYPDDQATTPTITHFTALETRRSSGR
jgi:hypothetical protein